jgi:hypothetical protein
VRLEPSKRARTRMLDAAATIRETIPIRFIAAKPESRA